MFTISPELIKQQAAASPEGHQETMSFVDGYILACQDLGQALDDLYEYSEEGTDFYRALDQALIRVQEHGREAVNLLNELKENT